MVLLPRTKRRPSNQQHQQQRVWNCHQSTTVITVQVIRHSPLYTSGSPSIDMRYSQILLLEQKESLVASSVSIIQQSNSGTKFQVSSSSCYDKITREQLLSSKAHALGLLSSKNWTKNTKASTSDNGDALLTRIRSLPGRIPKELNYMPTLDGVNESLHASNSRINSSKANSVTDTIHNRIQTAAAGTHMGHTRLANQSRPIHTSKGSSKSQHQRATSSTKPQLRNQRVPLASKLSHPKQRLSGIHHSRQLSSGSNISYIGQVSDRLQGILKVKHENSTFIRNSTSSMVAS